MDSICYNFEILRSEHQVFLDIQNKLKEVPLEANLCDSNEVFDLSKYSSLTEGEKGMRAICYPVYNDVTSSEIPGLAENIPMLKVDYENWRIKWNERIADNSKV